MPSKILIDAGFTPISFQELEKSRAEEDRAAMARKTIMVTLTSERRAIACRTVLTSVKL
jgi:hypothetical protein